ncbi:VapE domain-containing protein [Rhodoplanes roseus]|uniref:VapE domain-containing protein n=1 Tax=Rhodoplanes roseus TaxID=29409 RepID=UPI0011B815BC|nr:VapE domain-containing protein [Rhodoplanes roseus]
MDDNARSLAAGPENFDFTDSRGPVDAIGFIEEYLDELGLEVLFDDTILLKGYATQAESRADVERFLTQPTISLKDILDGARLHPRRHQHQLSVGDLVSALRQAVKARQVQRRKAVLRPLLAGTSETDRAADEWARLAGLFELEQGLAIGILRHFVWQVFQKVLGRPVDHHLVPVVFSETQGSGKTTFCRCFIGPLHELATGAALLSDLADPRSSDIFRFPVLFLDDLEKLSGASSPVLKAILTATSMRRRRLGTSLSEDVRQATTPIATSNLGIEKLVDDPTGHRRFVQLNFRNGNAEKGGDPKLWEIVRDTNYKLLWRSVDAFGPTPLGPHLRDLYRHQDASKPQNALLGWLRTFDDTRDDVKRIRTRDGVRARGLYELFVSDTRETISEPRFSAEMRRWLGCSGVPFADTVKMNEGRLYRFSKP